MATPNFKIGNSKFKKGSGAYNCSECGKLTRDTGNGEGSVRMCAKCYEFNEWVNTINDSDIEEIANAPKHLQARLREYFLEV